MKVIEKDNFIDVLEAGMEDDEYHAWRRVIDRAERLRIKSKQIPLVRFRIFLVG
jgi:hypothetical protein